LNKIETNNTGGICTDYSGGSDTFVIKLKLTIQEADAQTIAEVATPF
jgi:hypothetical protein